MKEKQSIFWLNEEMPLLLHLYAHWKLFNIFWVEWSAFFSLLWSIFKHLLAMFKMFTKWKKHDDDNSSRAAATHFIQATRRIFTKWYYFMAENWL